MKIDWLTATKEERKQALKYFTEVDVKNIQDLCKIFGAQVIEITDEITEGLSADDYLKWCEKSRRNQQDEQYIKERPYKNWKTK